MDEIIILTDNGRKVLEYMQKNTEVIVGKDLGEILGLKNIYLTLNALIKRGLVKAAEPQEREFVNKSGKAILKSYKTFVITSKGLHFELD